MKKSDLFAIVGGFASAKLAMSLVSHWAYALAIVVVIGPLLILAYYACKDDDE